MISCKLLRLCTGVSVNNMLISRLMSVSAQTNNRYDVIIAGGGMVGTTLACALGNSKKLSGKSILLLEGSKEFNWKLSDNYSNRVSALTPSTRNLLESIGAWKLIADVRYGPVKRMQVWDACSDAMITFNEDNMQDTLSYIVENDVLLHAVSQVIKNFDNVTVLHEAKINRYDLPNNESTPVNVHMEDGTQYSCSLLLGADGAKSKVRQTMGVQYLSWEYNQMGVVATLHLSELGSNVVAWQRFLPTGPIALLPLNDSQSSLVWTTTPEHAKELLRMPEEQFVDALNNALWNVYPRLDVVDAAMSAFNNLMKTLNMPTNAMLQLPPNICGVQEKSRAAFPLGFGHSTRYIANSVALVGDAAHRVHPLAGQGVNLGFGDVSCLLELLEEAIDSGSRPGTLLRNIAQYAAMSRNAPPGNKLTLCKYESRRQAHNIPTMLAVDGLQKLYGSTLTPVVLARSLGLQMTNALKPVKDAIMQHARC